jgi:DNA-directed RNA polymerase specialized sigma24 family protein
VARSVEQDDLRTLVDEEVQRLPAKYRAAVVLCYLEGKTYEQAAEELGCPRDFMRRANGCGGV